MCCMDAPEAQTLVKPRPTPAEPLSFANGGAIKRHHHHVPHVRPPSPLYRECLKNHAAAHGGHVLDGCGEFMPSPLASPADPTSLKCAACGCHRNFHRRDDDINAISLVVHNLSAGSDDAVNGDATPKRRSSSSASPPPLAATNPAPPPISSSYFPSAPQVLLALSTGLTGTPNGSVSPGAARKRFRTKFTREQKEKMFAFAEKIGWKMQKQDERIVEDFCEEVGVGKGVLKVWMHNNKHTLAKKDPLATTPVLTIERNNNSNQDNNNNNNNNSNNNNSSSNEIEQNNNGIHLFNGSSSSS